MSKPWCGEELRDASTSPSGWPTAGRTPTSSSPTGFPNGSRVPFGATRSAGNSSSSPRSVARWTTSASGSASPRPLPGGLRRCLLISDPGLSSRYIRGLRPRPGAGPRNGSPRCPGACPGRGDAGSCSRARPASGTWWSPSARQWGFPRAALPEAWIWRGWRRCSPDVICSSPTPAHAVDGALPGAVPRRSLPLVLQERLPRGPPPLPPSR
jgi:hypothetical protein